MGKQTKQLKNISIICQGTRGDFQPYLALAIELKEQGYNVRILTNIAYKKYTEEFDIEHVTIGEEDMEKFMQEDPGAVQSMSTGDVGKFLDAIAMQNVRQASTDCKAFIQEMTSNPPDILIVGTLCDYYMYYAKYVMGIHTFEVKLQSFVCSENYAPIGIPVLPNKAHYDILLNMMDGYYDGMVPFDDAMESMGRERVTEIFSKETYMEKMNDFINGQPKEALAVCQSSIFRRVLAPGSNDNLSFVGPCIVNSKEQKHDKTFFGGEETQKKIEAFLSQDPENKPVYCGWGSMICKSPGFMAELVVKALQISGERAAVLGGFAGLSIDVLKEHCPDDQELISFAEKNILFLDKVSHENLFPLMKCIVHHGGAGTTNAAFRSGVPTIITPVFTDQFDHSHVVNKMGNGYGFSKQFQQISAQELGDQIKKVAQSPEMLRRAKDVQAEVLEENGSKAVVSMIEEDWAKSA